jgi:hypothetical protein
MPLTTQTNMHSHGRNYGAKHLQTLVGLFDAYWSCDSAFCYRGAFAERFTSTIIDISEGSVFKREPMMNRKVSFLLVECFQHIIKHGESLSEEDQFKDEGIFTFQRINNDFIINSINHIQSAEISALREMVDQVNALDRDALKELYKKQLNNNEALSNKGGAGLGLIELARKSGHKLLYEFEPLKGSYSRFHQQVSFSDNEKSELNARNNIASTKNLYETLGEKDIFLFYKGDFSQKSILSLLDIVEQNVQGAQASTGITRRAAHVLVELLQNISKHGKEDEKERKEGIFLIGKTDETVFIQVGNIVSAKERDFLLDKLAYLSMLDQPDLKELHRAAMKASLKFENKNKSGLGLIEVIQASNGAFEYNFNQLESDKFLFGFHVTF